MRWRIGIASRSAYGYASAVWTLEISPIFVLSPVASIGLGPTQFLNDFEEMARRENELTNRNTSACGSLERELDGGVCGLRIGSLGSINLTGSACKCCLAMPSRAANLAADEASSTSTQLMIDH